MASPFASQTTGTVTMPDGETVTIHPLSGKDFEAAQYEHMTAVMTGRGRNWAQHFVRLASLGKATDADAEKVFCDPLSGFDRLTLVKTGVSAWTYPQAVTAEAIDDLVDEALEQLATAVLKLTKPALFQTDEERAEARKND